MRNEQERHATPNMMTVVDPYVYQTLQQLAGRHVVIQTTKDSVRGDLRDIKPDHVVVDVAGYLFFVRIQQIVWVMPYNK